MTCWKLGFWCYRQWLQILQRLLRSLIIISALLERNWIVQSCSHYEGHYSSSWILIWYYWAQCSTVEQSFYRSIGEVFISQAFLPLNIARTWMRQARRRNTSHTKGLKHMGTDHAEPFCCMTSMAYRGATSTNNNIRVCHHCLSFCQRPEHSQLSHHSYNHKHVSEGPKKLSTARRARERREGSWCR